MVMAIKEKSEKETVYKLSLTVGDINITSSGSSVLEALSFLKKPEKINGKAFLVVSEGDRRAERMFMPVACKRLFYPLSQRFLAKQIEFLLK